MFGRKKKIEAQAPEAQVEKIDITKEMQPVIDSGNYILEQKDKLQQEEQNTSDALGEIKRLNFSHP